MNINIDFDTRVDLTNPHANVTRTFVGGAVTTDGKIHYVDIYHGALRDTHIAIAYMLEHLAADTNVEIGEVRELRLTVA